MLEKIKAAVKTSFGEKTTVTDGKSSGEMDSGCCNCQSSSSRLKHAGTGACFAKFPAEVAQMDEGRK